MLIVEIAVNNTIIAKETAVRIEGGSNPNSKNVYELSDGCKIRHTYGKGALKLAKKMIKHLELPAGRDHEND
jgi:hypothetical protein